MTANLQDLPGWQEYQAKKDAHRYRIAKACGEYQDSHPDGLRELKADERREAKRDARHARGELNEHEEQKLVVEWLESRPYPLKFFAVCNGVVFGIPRDKACAYASYLRAEGKRKGVPDLWIGPAPGKRHWLVLEMKKIGAPEPPEEQREWLDYCESTGIPALVAWGHTQAIERLTEAGY